MTNSITPFLWFDDKAEEAIQFYMSIFSDSELVDRSDGPDGKLFTATFRLNGREFMALNGGPMYRFTEAISLMVSCRDQAEVDDLWEKLVEGGEESQCGWLKDRFGLSWQVIPTALGELLGDPDREKAGRVMEAMLKMQKISVPELEAAYRG